MDLLTVLSTCSLASDFGLVLAMAITYSQGEPYTVRAAADVGATSLNAPMITADEDAPPTQEAARSAMKRLKHPIVGLLPVPLGWAARYQRKPEDLLDACTGVVVATAQLSEFERACAGRRGARKCALHAYVAAAGIPLFELAVLDTLRAQHLLPNAAVAVETEEILSAGLFAPGARAERGTGADRVLVAVDAAPVPDSAPAKKSEAQRANNESNEKR